MSFYNSEIQQLIKSLKFAMYLRRSSKDNEDKQMRSIPGQIEDLEPIINNNHIKLVTDQFEEKNSAFEMGRPKFAELVSLIEMGEVNAVLVWHPNRIARNYFDGGKFVQLMSDGKLKLVLTPHGFFQNSGRDKEYLMTEFTRATRDSDDKSEAVKRGNRTKLKEGHIPGGRLGQGFIHQKNSRGESINIADPDRFPLLQKAMNLVLNQSHTPLEALDKLNLEWGYRTRQTRRCTPKPLSRSCWYSILADKKYCGEIDRSEGVFNAGFSKMIEPDDFEKIQVILGRKGRRRTRKEWAFAGEMTCGECSGAIINDEKWQIICPECKTKFHKGRTTNACPECRLNIEDMKQPKILHYHWLRCGKTKKLLNGHRCSQKSVQIDDFESQVDKILKEIQIPKDFTDWAIAVLNDQSEKEVDDRQLVEENLTQGLSDIKQKLDNLLMLKIAPNNMEGEVIPEEEYIRQRESLMTEKQTFERQLKNQSKRQDKWMELSQRTFNFACYARYWFDVGTREQKRSILHALGLNLKIQDKKLLIDPFKPFQVIADMKQEHAEILERFEPENNVDTSIHNSPVSDVIPSLLPG